MRERVGGPATGQAAQGRGKWPRASSAGGNWRHLWRSPGTTPATALFDCPASRRTTLSPAAAVSLHEHRVSELCGHPSSISRLDHAWIPFHARLTNKQGQTPLTVKISADQRFFRRGPAARERGDHAPGWVAHPRQYSEADRKCRSTPNSGKAVDHLNRLGSHRKPTCWPPDRAWALPGPATLTWDAEQPPAATPACIEGAAGVARHAWRDGGHRWT